ncbi:MAG: hypothetical protein P8X73_08325 [Ignavibacteriaceae bacterium]
MEFLAELHPKVVHFPIALFLTFALFELLGTVLKKEYINKAAHLILFLGVIGSVLAVLSGKQAAAANIHWTEASSALIKEHVSLANITMWYFVGLLVLKTYLVLKKKMNLSFNYIILILAVIGCYFIYQTSEHGGQLVTKFGIGTELNAEQERVND